MHVCWWHNMRDNLMSTQAASLPPCPPGNVLIKIKRNFFDFDFIKCDLNELGHISPPIQAYIYAIYSSVSDAD